MSEDRWAASDRYWKERRFRAWNSGSRWAALYLAAMVVGALSLCGGLFLFLRGDRDPGAPSFALFLLAASCAIGAFFGLFLVAMAHLGFVVIRMFKNQ